MFQLDAKAFLGIIDATPLVSVDLIISDDQGKALLGKRANAPAKGFWFVPGGRILKNESIATALARVARNETGLQGADYTATLFGVYDHMYEDNVFAQDGISTHYVVLAHRLALAADWQQHTDEQHTAMKWWPISEIVSSAEVHPHTRAYFQAWT